jgi:hypothetical protein
MHVILKNAARTLVFATAAAFRPKITAITAMARIGLIVDDIDECSGVRQAISPSHPESADRRCGNSLPNRFVSLCRNGCWKIKKGELQAKIKLTTLLYQTGQVEEHRALRSRCEPVKASDSPLLPLPVSIFRAVHGIFY